jgi:repressor LexA
MPSFTITCLKEGGILMRHRDLDKQQKILDFVNRQVAEKGYPPSVREICQAVGFKSLQQSTLILRSWKRMGRS